MSVCCLCVCSKLVLFQIFLVCKFLCLVQIEVIESWTVPCFNYTVYISTVLYYPTLAIQFLTGYLEIDGQ